MSFHSLKFFSVTAGGTVYPLSNKTIDLGIAGGAFDDVWADDYQNEADFFNLDSRDDIATIKTIKGSGITNLGFSPFGEYTLSS